MDQHEARLPAAAHAGDVDLVRQLIERERINPNLRAPTDGLAWTPLHYASKEGHFPVVQYLVEEAQANARIVDLNGWTALHVACIFSRARIVRYLVETAALRVQAVSNYGNTPLHIACRHDDCMEIIRYLVEHQEANVEVVNRHGATPLQVALSREDMDVVRYLLPRMTSVNKKALSLASSSGFPWDIKKLALEKYAAGIHRTEALTLRPIQTILAFPLPPSALERFIKHFPSSAFSLTDRLGRLPIHVSLSAAREAPTVTRTSPSLVLELFKRQRRSALVRDPTTGMYPYEVAALQIESSYDQGHHEWMNVVFQLFRCNPVVLLSARGFDTATSSKPDPLFKGCHHAERQQLRSSRLT